MMRLVRSRLGVSIVACAIAAISAGCGVLPLPPATQPSPTTLADLGIGVGSVVACDGAAMRRHCESWIAVARDQAGVASSDVASATVHVGWSVVARSTSVSVVVALSLRDGSSLYEPIFCGVGVDPQHVCRFTDVSLPPN